MNGEQPNNIRLSESKRVLFLTKDLDLIRKQLYEGLNLRMEDLSVEDLLDDINTDVMTPAWVCFDHDPAEIAKNAYAGLMHSGMRVSTNLQDSSSTFVFFKNYFGLDQNCSPSHLNISDSALEGARELSLE